MKKNLLLIIALCGITATTSATWQEDLVNLNKGLIDSIVPAPQKADTFKNLQSYTIYYHQPILHANAQGENFPLRAHLIVRTDKDIKTGGLLINIGGYDIKDSATYYTCDMAEYPESSIIELASRYNLHMLVPEHRYFKYSSPTLPWTKAEGIKAVEAAADFHALINGVKKVFTSGRYMMAGVSKGGITTAMQGLFYPEDAHYYVPYAAPFCDSIVDPRQSQYMQTKGWTEELRTRMHNLQSEAINSDDAMNWAMETYFQSKDTARFFESVASYEMDHHAYGHRSDIVAYLDRFQFLSDSLAKKGRGLRGQHLGYIMCYGNSETVNYKTRLDSMVIEFSEYRGPARKAVKPLTVDSGCVSNAYFYQAYTELGYLSLDPVVFVANEKKAWARSIWEKYDPRDSIFRPLQYTSDLRNTVMKKMETFQGTMVYIYGEDDHWTGAAMEDKYINKKTTFKYILPENNHSDAISRMYDKQFGGKYAAIADEIWAILDKAIPTEVENTVAEMPQIECKKILIDGQLIIIRNGVKYDLKGLRIK